MKIHFSLFPSDVCSDIVWLAAAAGVPVSPPDYREPALMSLATLTLGPQ